ncbi:LOW QUALITY PROTEIN: A-kinase anchor protein 7-like [Pholidichthys leucotaenia]
MVRLAKVGKGYGSSPKKCQYRKKRTRKRGDSGGRVDSEEDGEKKKKKEGQRPNYFVSIPFTNTQISTAVAEVQEAILQQEPQLVKAMIPVPTFHITLLVMHLSNQEQVDLLQKSRQLLRSRFEEQGLLQGDCHGFEPHFTIMKLSRASKLRSQLIMSPARQPHTNKGGLAAVSLTLEEEWAADFIQSFVDEDPRSPGEA